VKKKKKKKIKFKTEPKAEKWAEKNHWFGKNKTLTYLAFDTHTELVNLGISTRSKLYYNLIDIIMGLLVSRSVKLKKIYNKNTVRLTAAQILIAKKLGVPLKHYARKI